jgi:hypothetical protein
MHETRSARARRALIMRIGVWIFIGVFAFSVAGGLLIMAAVKPVSQ